MHRNTHTRIRRIFQYTARTNGYLLGTHKLQLTSDANKKSPDLNKTRNRKINIYITIRKSTFTTKHHKNPRFTSCAKTCNSKHICIYFNNNTLSDLNIKAFKFIININFISGTNNCLLLFKKFDISRFIKKHHFILLLNLF